MVTNVADIGQLVSNLQESNDALLEAAEQYEAATTARDEAQEALHIQVYKDVMRYFGAHPEIPRGPNIGEIPHTDILEIRLYYNFEKGEGRDARDIPSQFAEFVEKYPVKVKITVE